MTEFKTKYGTVTFQNVLDLRIRISKIEVENTKMSRQIKAMQKQLDVYKGKD